MACYNFDGTALQFFEVRTTTSVFEIAAEVNGVIRPDRFLHAVDPLTIYVFDPVGFKDGQVDRFWIYAWQDGRYVNRSVDYVSEYEDQIAQAAERLQQSRGQSVTGYQIEGDMNTILLLSDSLRLSRADALATFLEVTQPDLWINLDQETHCWLQYTRARAQLDYEAGKPFSDSLFQGFELRPPEYSLANIATEVSPERFDISACLGE